MAHENTQNSMGKSEQEQQQHHTDNNMTLCFDPIKMGASFELSTGHGVSAPVASAPLFQRFSDGYESTHMVFNQAQQHSHTNSGQMSSLSQIFSNIPNPNHTKVTPPFASSHSPTHINSNNTNSNGASMQNSKVQALLSVLNRPNRTPTNQCDIAGNNVNIRSQTPQKIPDHMKVMDDTNMMMKDTNSNMVMDDSNENDSWLLSENRRLTTENHELKLLYQMSKNDWKRISCVLNEMKVFETKATQNEYQQQQHHIMATIVCRNIEDNEDMD
eukprot:257327_1